MFGIIIDVDDLSSERFHIGVSLLKDGGGLRFRGIEMIRADGAIQCAAMATESEAAQLSESVAEILIQRARDTYSKLCELSEEFRQATSDLPIRYSVVHHYGHGSVTLYRDQHDYPSG